MIQAFIFSSKTRKIDNKEFFLVFNLQKKGFFWSKQKDFKSIMEIVSNTNKLNNENKYIDSSFNWDNSELSLLRLIITTRCNMNCAYCYADQGNYGEDIKNMSCDTAIKAVNYLLKKYRKIREVSFFGGEPLLNFNLIKNVVSHINNICSKCDTKFSIVTNGTIFNNEIIDYFNANNIMLTISLDSANEYINDYNRKFYDGRGTYSTVSKNIMKAIKNLDRIPVIEITYTKKHEQEGYSKADVLKSLYDQFGLKFYIFNREDSYNNLWSHLSKEDYLKEFESCLSLYLEFGIISRDLATFFSSLYERNGSKNFCNAGFGQLSIIPNGDVYPCQMFAAEHHLIDKKSFLLGNIDLLYKGEACECKKFNYVSNYFKNENTKKIQKCKTCLFYDKCSDCIFQSKAFLNKTLIYRNKCVSNNDIYMKKIKIFMDYIIDENNERKFRERTYELSKIFSTM